MALTLSLAGLLFAVLVTSAYTDVAKGKIYNWCTFPAIALGIAGHIWLNVEGGEWFFPLRSVLGLALGAGIFLLPYYLGLVGGGDVKLMGAIGAIRGPNFTLLALFLSAVVGAVFGFAVLIWKGRFAAGLKSVGGAMFTPWKLREKAREDDTRIPYGLAIALGTFWAWFVAEGFIN